MENSKTEGWLRFKQTKCILFKMTLAIEHRARTREISYTEKARLSGKNTATTNKITKQEYTNPESTWAAVENDWKRNEIETNIHYQRCKSTGKTLNRYVNLHEQRWK